MENIENIKSKISDESRIDLAIAGENLKDDALKGLFQSGHNESLAELIKLNTKVLDEKEILTILDSRGIKLDGTQKDNTDFFIKFCIAKKVTNFQIERLISRFVELKRLQFVEILTDTEKKDLEEFLRDMLKYELKEFGADHFVNLLANGLEKGEAKFRKVYEEMITTHYDKLDDALKYKILSYIKDYLDHPETKMSPNSTFHVNLKIEELLKGNLK